tara:strand:+ start:824 stop:1426 length:603 start_codon:yes stop_codon:yes gene_type:complete
MKINILNIPNFISFIRIFLCFPLITYLEKIPPKLNFYNIEPFRYELYMVLIIVMLIIISDLIDGLLARILDQVTDFGKLIDPVADKIAILIIMIYLTQKPGFEGLSILIFFILLLIRDFYIGLNAIFFIKKYNHAFDSIKSGKWFIASTATMFLFFIYDPMLIKFVYIKWFFYSISIILMIFSTYEYFHRYNSFHSKIEK